MPPPVGTPYKNLPKELQRLITHTDKGVERLYRAAASFVDDAEEEESSREGGHRQRRHRNSAAPRPARQQQQQQEQRRQGGAVSRRDVLFSRSLTPTTTDDSGDASLSDVSPLPHRRPLRGDTARTTSVHKTPTQRQRRSSDVAGADRHTPQPTCVLVEKRRARRGDASTLSDLATTNNISRLTGRVDRDSGRQRSTSTQAPELTTPARSQASQSLFLSPEKSGHWGDDTVASYVSGTVATSAPMRTRFGQKWSKTFDALFRSDDAGPSTAGDAHAAATPPPQSSAGGHQQQQQQQQQPVAALHNPLLGHGTERTPPGTADCGDDAVAAPSQVVVVASPPPPSPTTAPETQLNGLLVERLKEELREKDGEMVKLRLDHALELAAAKEKIIEARREGAREVAEHMSASNEVKQEALQAALHVEQQRVRDAQVVAESLREENAKLEARVHAAEDVHGTLDDRTRELAAAVSRGDDLEKTLQARSSDVAALRSDLDTARRSLERAEQVEEELRRRLRTLEQQLLDQENRARATLSEVEAEFNATTQSYQQLLSEAAARMGSLERVQRRYKELKDTHRSTQAAAKDAKESGEERAREWAAEKTRLSEELASVREELRETEANLKALGATHETALEELQRQSEAQRLSSSDHAKLMRSQLETANHTIELLRTQIEALKDDVAEERAHGQQLAMSMAEKELALQQEKQELQRSAASHKVNSEEAMAALRRQLREKDAQLKALAASQAEPLQRVRGQLEDERGRRARLEEQLSQYKRRAKEAEEAALLEIRRERLRNAAFLSTRTPVSAGQRSGTASSHQTASARGAMLSSTPPPPPPPAAPRRRASDEVGGTGSSLQMNSRRHRRERTRPDDGDDGAALWGRETLSPPRVQTTSIAEVAVGPRDAGRGRDDSGGKGVSPASATLTAANGRGFESISGISLNTPCKSASSLLQGDRHGHEEAAVGGDRASPRQEQFFSALEAPEEGRGDGGGAAASPGRRPWYEYRTPPVVRTTVADGASASAGQGATPRSLDGRRSGPVRSPPAIMSPAESFHAADPAAERDGGVAPDADHERRLDDFHASASHVLHKIAASREDFMAQCAAIVRQSATAQREAARELTPRLGDAHDGYSLSDTTEDSAVDNGL